MNYCLDERKYFSDTKITKAVKVAGILICLLFIHLQTFAQYGSYVRTWEAFVRETNPNTLMSLPSNEVRQTTQYYDGLGRPIQTVIKGGSMKTGNSATDMVNPFEYDELGRQVNKYLPYKSPTEDGDIKLDPVTELNNFYGTDPSSPVYGQGENNFYQKTFYENSPLNRILKTESPGNSWVGNDVGVSTDYFVNTQEVSNGSDDVRIWNIDYSPGSVPVTSNVYQTGQLYKTVVTDENGKQEVTYTDKSGNVILKKFQDKEPGAGLTAAHSGWLCTYYVYDDFGKQRFIIPPKAVVYLDSHSWILSTDVVNELCFSNEYDNKGRLIVKKSPGAEPVYMVYDNRDRLVFSQDGNQRTQSKWSATLYDNLDRPTLAGLIDYSSTREDLQDLVDAQSNSNTNEGLTTSSQTPSVIEFSTDIRDPSISDYKASSSITFNPGFASEPGANFIAEIGTTSQSVNSTVSVNENPLPPNNELFVLTMSFYDDYAYDGAKTFSSDFTIDNSVPANEAEDLQQSHQTLGLITGTKVRLLDGSNTFLTTTSFYDAKGRLIQVKGDNHKGFSDENTTQYDFSGKVRSTYAVTRFDNSQGINVFTRNSYDDLQRLSEIDKSINGSAEKTIASYSYDALGQLSNKTLAPGFAGPDGSQLESLDYTYNIQGWLLGINKDYASSDTREGHFFGMELGYDKAGNQGFTNLQTNGNIAGNAWKTRSDNVIRKYDYTYDNENQLLNAAFNQKNTTGASWTKDKMDFTSNYGYDENGNIASQNQWGIAPGTSPQQIDKMFYHYDDVITGGETNRLSHIEEQSAGASNGLLGDFKNGTAGSSVPQYDYDNNGNLTKDLNKEIGSTNSSGIQYNYMNLPTLVTFTATNKTISYVYDAAGNKLRKILDEPANGTTPARHVETDYLDGFVYENNELQFFSHEEGRVRVITPYGNQNEANYDGGGITLPNGKQGVFDYFIKDQLGNVRMILTEEIKKNSDVATMEDADPDIKQHEEAVFGQLGGNNEVNVTRVDKPTDGCGTHLHGWESNSSARVSKLSGLTHKIGPNVIVKVMGGDKISAKADYYYMANNSNVSNPNLLSSIVTSLINSMTTSNTSDLVKGNSTIIQNDLENDNNGLIRDFVNPQESADPQGSPPKGYLNIIFFDEQFNYVSSYAQRISVSCDDPREPLILSGKEAPKNGYAYIYVSNESDEPVYFDNFQVTHEQGKIIEENHYYSYGLKIDGLSSRAPESVLNKYGYQGDFSEHDDETGLDEFDLRHYDPQIGRWTTTDPYEQFANPYLGMGNSPLSFIDPDGGGLFDWFAVMGKTGIGLIHDIGNHSATLISNGLTLINVGGDDLSEAEALSNAVKSFDLAKEARLVLNLNISCHGDFTQLRNAAFNELVAKYNSLDRAHGQVDFPQSTLDKFFNGQRSYTGMDPRNGNNLVNAGVDDQGYLTKYKIIGTESPFELLSPSGELTTVESAAKEIQYSEDLEKFAQQLYPNKAGKIELHHIMPKYLGGPADGPLAPLDASYHQLITNEFRRIHPYGLPKPDINRVVDIMKEVYSKFPLPPAK